MILYYWAFYNVSREHNINQNKPMAASEFHVPFITSLSPQLFCSFSYAKYAPKQMQGYGKGGKSRDYRRQPVAELKLRPVSHKSKYLACSVVNKDKHPDK